MFSIIFLANLGGVSRHIPLTFDFKAAFRDWAGMDLAHGAFTPSSLARSMIYVRRGCLSFLVVSHRL